MKNNGFTLIELLVVIGIIAILGLLSSPFLSSFIARNNLENTTSKIISSFRKAQNYSIENKNDSEWGVCITNGAIRMYKTTCLASEISDDFSFPSNVSVSGLNDTKFSKLYGEPTSPLSVTISNSYGSKTMTLNAIGGLTIN